MFRSMVALAFVGTICSFNAFAEAIPLRNWAAPPTWTPPSFGQGDISAMAELSNPLPFIPVDPCRLADTRGFGFSGDYGPPALPPSGERTFTITGRCSIPASAKAVSFNFTVAEMGSAGNLKIWPTGGTVSTVSTINWTGSTFVIANAAVGPLSDSGQITVRNESATSTQLIIDVNGFYYDADLGELTPGQAFQLVGDYSPGGLLWSYNLSAGLFAYGVEGWIESNANDSAGVAGYSFGPFGRTYGVYGQTDGEALDSAGILGVSPGGFFNGCCGWSAGVRGISASEVGVLGEGGLRGVQGVRVTITDGKATGVAVGVLGFAGTSGVHSFHDYTGAGAKYFVEPHPTEAGLIIKYVALEGPEAGTYFRGRGRFHRGTALIAVPEDFRHVTDEEGLSVQITPIGEKPTAVSVAEVSLQGIVVRASQDVEFFYTVNGVRKAFKGLNPILPDTDGFFLPLSPDDRMQFVYPEESRRRLIANGTYNPDGTVNMETAERLGWVSRWREREQQQADEKNGAERATKKARRH